MVYSWDNNERNHSDIPLVIYHELIGYIYYYLFGFTINYIPLYGIYHFIIFSLHGISILFLPLMGFTIIMIMMQKNRLPVWICRDFLHNGSRISWEIMGYEWDIFMGQMEVDCGIFSWDISF
jgi:hypothetical protein